MPRRPRFRTPNMRGVVVVMPSAFTLGNLFFGFWSMVNASQGNFIWAGWFLVFAGILDMLDGRIARRANAGTRFGAELDSLVDAISFGVAPAVFMYFLEFQNTGRSGWVICYIYVVAVTVRLARFNILAHGKPHSNWFTGLPSPSALAWCALPTLRRALWITGTIALGAAAGAPGSILADQANQQARPHALSAPIPR